MVCRYMCAQHIEDDVQGSIGIQVEVSDQADDLLPDWASATLDNASGFRGQTGFG